MIIILFAVVVFCAWGVVLWRKKRARLEAAMVADGFTVVEVRRALRLFDRKRYHEMEDFCRGVIERRALIVGWDWTKPEAYC